MVGALDALPSLPLENEKGAPRQKATGTDGSGALAPTSDNSGTSEAYTGKRAALSAGEQYSPKGVVTVGNDKTRQALSNADNAHKKWAVQDLNLWPPACKAGASDLQAVEHKEVTNNGNVACTAACTCEPENGHESSQQVPPETGDKKPSDPEMVDLLSRLERLTPEQRRAVRALLDK